MMNALALSLLVSSLAAAGMFSPQQKQGANTIVKEGHRVVVVEYDQDGHQNTKISISPPEPEHHSDSNLIDNARDKIKEAASVFPDMGMTAGSQDHDSAAFLHAPKELICDAYGRCKHKIAGAMGKAKDKAQEAIDKKKDMEEAVVDAVGKAKDTVYDKAKESVEKGKDTGQAIKDHVVRNVSEASDSVQGAMKRFASTTLVGGGPLGSSVMGVASLLGFATAYGMSVWITFISSYVLSKAMPRQQFVVVQSKIYPVYFRAMAYSVGIALLGHVLGHRNRIFSNKPEMLQAYNLLASLLTIFFNSVYLEPKATKVMFERMKLEKEEGRGRTEEHERTADPKTPSPTTGTVTAAQGHDAVRSRMIKLNNKLKRLNSHSSLLNILNLMSLTWHLVYLAQRVHQTC